MKKLTTLYKQILREHTEVEYELYSRMNEWKSRVLQQFFQDNNPDFTLNIPWRLISYPRLKKIWEDWAEYGFVRDEKGLEDIENIMVSNTIKIGVLTELAGHTSDSPDEDYEDAWGEYIDSYINQINFGGDVEPEDPNQLEFDWDNETGEWYKKKKVVQPSEVIKNPFFDSMIANRDLSGETKESLRAEFMDELIDRFLNYYIEDPEIGQARISDYGLEPLQKHMISLVNASDSSQKVVIIDRMLNVVHQRSDMASWFVRGGSKALSDLSASPSEREN